MEEKSFPFQNKFRKWFLLWGSLSFFHTSPGTDASNMFVKDNRNEIVYEYRIPELTPIGSNIAIQGNFDIKISGTGITDESSSQKVDYDIYVKDRAANKSNTITTSSITIQQ